MTLTSRIILAGGLISSAMLLYMVWPPDRSQLPDRSHLREVDYVADPPRLTLAALALDTADRSDDDTFVQVGHWSFDYPGYSVTGDFVCPVVKFPKEFGGKPNVVFVNNSFNWGFIAFKEFRDITPQGFTPVISRGGYRGGHPSGTVWGDWIAVGPRLHRGTAVAKYLVLTVVYAPPGTSAGASAASSVTYSAGSTAGTTLSASQSFQVANSLSLETSGGFMGSGGSAGISFDYSHSSTDSQSYEIRKSTSTQIKESGPTQDGMSHDEDEIWLLLKPTVNLALSSSAASWTLAPEQKEIQSVKIGWLNGHYTMPPGVLTRLQSAGITPQDYPDIISRNPLAARGSPDPRRFVPLNTTFPYEPPLTAGGSVTPLTFIITDSSSATTGSEVTETYKVGLTVSATGGFFDFAKATLKDTLSWSWTNKSSQSTTTGTSQSASVTVGGPAFGYTGNTLVQVYYDTLYKTFAFAFVPVESRALGLDGTLLNAAGKPLPGTEVTLFENDVKYRTFTNVKGEYKFYGRIDGPMKIQAGGITKSVPQEPRTVRHVDLKP